MGAIIRATSIIFLVVSLLLSLSPVNPFQASANLYAQSNGTVPAEDIPTHELNFSEEELASATVPKIESDMTATLDISTKVAEAPPLTATAIRLLDATTSRDVSLIHASGVQASRENDVLIELSGFLAHEQLDIGLYRTQQASGRNGLPNGLRLVKIWRVVTNSNGHYRERLRISPSAPGGVYTLLTCSIEACSRYYIKGTETVAGLRRNRVATNPRVAWDQFELSGGELIEQGGPTYGRGRRPIWRGRIARVDPIKAANGLNMRSGPGLRYWKIDLLPPNRRLVIIGGPKYKHGKTWYRVEDTKTWFVGWVSGECLLFGKGKGKDKGKDKGKHPGPGGGNGTPRQGAYVDPVLAWNGLHLRDRAGGSSIGVLPPNRIVRILGGPVVENEVRWLQIADTVTNMQGWAMERYLLSQPVSQSYINLNWPIGCNPPRQRVELLQGRQTACARGVETRTVDDFADLLREARLLQAGEKLIVEQPTTPNQAFAIYDGDTKLPGWIYIGRSVPHSGGNSPVGAVWRADSAGRRVGQLCWMRSSYAWRCESR